jgi:hypothetical protein
MQDILIGSHGGRRPGAGRPPKSSREDGIGTPPIKTLSPGERFNKARADKEEQAAILKKLEVQDALVALRMKSGALIPAQDVERAFSRFVTLVVTMLDTLPDVLERDAGITGEAVALAQAAVDKIRRDLHAKLTSDLGQARDE